MLVSTRSIHGFMSKLIKKYWTDSIRYVILMRKNMLLCYSSSPQQGFIHLLRQIKRKTGRNLYWKIEVCAQSWRLKFHISTNFWKSWSSILDSRACQLDSLAISIKCATVPKRPTNRPMVWNWNILVRTTLHTWFRECACLFSSSERPCPRVY